MLSHHNLDHDDHNRNNYSSTVVSVAGGACLCMIDNAYSDSFELNPMRVTRHVIPTTKEKNEKASPFGMNRTTQHNTQNRSQKGRKTSNC